MDTIQKWHIPKLLEIVRWSFGRVFTMLAVIGWVIFITLMADTILFNGKGLIELL